MESTVVKVDILKDKLKNEQLFKHGFALLDFFTDSEIHEIQLEFNRLHDFSFPKDQLYSSNRKNDSEYQILVKNYLTGILKSKLETFFENYQLVEPVFNVKAPGVGEFTNHQDWTMVDENKSRSFAVWIPLIDVDENNGTLSLLEGSHHYHQTYRSSTIPPIYDFFEEESKELINTHKTTFKFKKGQGIVFDNGCIHSTAANHSDEVRGAIIFGIINKNVQLLHHYLNKTSNEIEEYNIQSDFFYRYDYESRPTQSAELVRHLKYQQAVISSTELYRKINSHTLPLINKY